MRTLSLLLFCIVVINSFILSHEHFVPRENKKLRIAVIGSGIGGSSFVHYFNKQKNNKYGSVIDIYDKNDYVGGRTKSINIDGDMIELGASMAIKDNKYIYNLVNELGLKHQLIKQQKQNGNTAIWNERNKSFSFMSYASDSWLNMPYTLWHFGPKKLFDLFMLSRNFVSKMENIYQYQNLSKTFKTAQQFYEIMDVYYLSQVNCLEYLSYHLHGEKRIRNLEDSPILNELVMGITRVNYNQNFYDLNALVCMTSISALGNTQSDSIWNVKQGNQYLSKKMIQNAIKSNNKPEDNSIKLKLSMKVISISKLNDNAPYKYRLSYKDVQGSNIQNRYYDAIVIAAPLNSIDCKFIDFDVEFYTNLNIATHIDYQKVYATLVKGTLNQQYFDENNNINSDNFNEINDLLISGYYPQNIERAFNSISRKKVLPNNTNIYKIFSTKSINNKNILNQIFSFYENDVIEQYWNGAYPIYPSKAVFPKIMMDDGIYYVNAVESGASAMEIITISAKNIALLLHKYFLRVNEEIHSNESEHDEL